MTDETHPSPESTDPEPTGVGRARRVALHVRMLWFAPMLVGRLAMGDHTRLDHDIARWRTIVHPPAGERLTLLALLASYREFRTLYCYRLRRSGVLGAAISAVLGVVYPGERTLHLACGDIGGGCFIQHGFATVVAARRVGADAWINQQVTIGFDRPGARPSIGDGVSVHAGAKVLGDITLGNGVRVGANAVVVTDVPAGYTAVGVPARLLPPKSQRG